jgi:hypothetical protein
MNKGSAGMSLYYLSSMCQSVDVWYRWSVTFKKKFTCFHGRGPRRKIGRNETEIIFAQQTSMMDRTYLILQ